MSGGNILRRRRKSNENDEQKAVIEPAFPDYKHNKMISFWDKLCCKSKKPSTTLTHVYIMSNISSFTSLIALCGLIFVGLLMFIKFNDVIYPEALSNGYNFMKDLALGYFRGYFINIYCFFIFFIFVLK